MIEFNEDIPFLWRLSSQGAEGICAVSMVVPFNDGNESLEHTIETDVLSFASDISNVEEEELEWNEEDLSLFLKLISSRGLGPEGNPVESIRVDLADPETIEIVQIVAAAGFGLALPSDDVLAYSSKTLLSCDFDIGSQVSVNTVQGYKRCVVVDMDDDDVVCVMLEKIEAESSQFETVNPYDLLLLKRHHILHPEYTSSLPAQTAIRH